MEKIKSPVIFIPGLFISETDFYKKYSGLPDFAEQFCETFIIQKFNPGTNLEQRSTALIATLNQFNSFHIVSHSRGGIDARYSLYKMPELQKACKSLTTLSSPHRGSPLADYFFSDPNGPVEFLLQQILGLDTSIESQVKELTSGVMEALDKQMGIPSCPIFCLPFIIDQEWKAGALDQTSHGYLKSKGFPDSDGVVPFQSQLFGKELGDDFVLGHKINYASHIAETAPLRYGLPFCTVWKDVFIRVFENMKTQE